MKFIYSTLLMIFLGSVSSLAQVTGCTDPLALNYNVNATVNDGSCVYEFTSIEPELLISNLNDQADETSGLVLHNGLIFTHNDSGGEAALYGFNVETGTLEQVITIGNAINVDWEDLTEDDNFIYIGDFGNNNGNRTDLTIYKISKADIPSTGNATVNAELITFAYADQPSLGDTDYDCEAMFAYGESLFLFSKSWVTQNTRVYEIPKQSGNYIPSVNETFDVNGLITAADIVDNRVVLLGYKDYVPFLWLLFDYQGIDFFSGNKRRIDMNPITARQTEGVCFKDQDYIYISSEKTALMQNQLFGLNIGQWISNTTDIQEARIIMESKVDIFYDSSSQTIKIKKVDDELEISTIDIFDVQGKKINHSENPMVNNKTTGIFAGNLKKGLYFIRIRSNEDAYIGKVMIF